MLRHWLGDVENQKAPAGVLITLENQAKQMRTEAPMQTLYVKLCTTKIIEIQILTVEVCSMERTASNAPPQINPFAWLPRESARRKRGQRCYDPVAFFFSVNFE